MTAAVRLIEPAAFEAVNHDYPRVPNARLHPVVRHFLSLGNERIAQRYCHLHPEVDPVAVRKALSRPSSVLKWAGADLLVTTTDRGHRQLVVVEVNSSPSGQKSMPLVHEEDGDHRLRGGPGRAHRRARLPGPPPGGRSGPGADLGRARRLAVARRPGQARPRLLPLRDPAPLEPPAARVQGPDAQPGARLPGRRPQQARGRQGLRVLQRRAGGLRIRVPETIWDVSSAEVPLWVQRMGGVAVAKNPYSNAGQGVYTPLSDQELQDFMALEHRYDRFIVQALVGNVGWSSKGAGGRLYHVGTVPDRRGKLYASDLRFMVGSGPDGFLPLALYARRARHPLTEAAPVGNASWGMLGTNLSKKLDGGTFTTEPERLMLMDSRDFNDLGIGLDDLTEGYLQTVLAVTAIDRMAERLLTRKGVFRRRLFRDLNPDPAFLAEVSR